LLVKSNSNQILLLKVMTFFHGHPPPPAPPAPRQVRHGYALRPDVHALVEALLRGGVEVPEGRVESIGYGSIPIDTIFSGMNIHLPAILGFTRYQGFDPFPIEQRSFFQSPCAVDYY